MLLTCTCLPTQKQLYNEVKEIISIVKPISTGVLSLKDDIFLQIRCSVSQGPTR